MQLSMQLFMLNPTHHLLILLHHLNVSRFFLVLLPGGLHGSLNQRGVVSMQLSQMMVGGIASVAKPVRVSAI
jgi:hypothetical protein